jgi:hypothetical protein
VTGEDDIARFDSRPYTVLKLLLNGWYGRNSYNAISDIIFFTLPGQKICVGRLILWLVNPFATCYAGQVMTGKVAIINLQVLMFFSVRCIYESVNFSIKKMVHIQKVQLLKRPTLKTSHH